MERHFARLVALFIPGVGHKLGSVGLFVSDISILNPTGNKRIDDLRFYYTPIEGTARGWKTTGPPLSLPPMIYGWVSPIPEVERTNALLRLWTTVHPESSVPSLVGAGVTHAYIGSTAHSQTRNIMRSCARFRMIYERDGVLMAEMKTDR